MTKNHYKTFDIMFFCLLAFVLSLLSELLFKYLKISFYVDFGILIALILIVRWGFIGSISYVIYGIPIVLFRGNELYFSILNDSLIHMFLGLIVIGFKFYERDLIGKNFFITLIYILSSYLILIIVKSTTMLILNHNLLNNIYMYVASMLLSFVLVLLAFYFIGYFSDGLIIDMNKYLKERSDEVQN